MTVGRVRVTNPSTEGMEKRRKKNEGEKFGHHVVAHCDAVLVRDRLVGCATKRQLTDLEAKVDQALSEAQSAQAKATDATAQVKTAEAAAVRAEQAAKNADNSANRAEAMANKAEAVFMQKMKK